jgi:hypothetical protein
VKRNEITKEEGNRLKPKDCHAPRLSGIPKIHKEDVPMRRMVTTVGSLEMGNGQRAMKTSPYPLDQWYWYVDDSELKCKEGQSEEVLEHLNNIKPGVIVFTKEDDILPVLDLKQRVDRKTKQVECMVHYKKTHTNINVKERSNHPPSMKKGIIKGFVDRARALCDDKHLEDELKNVEDVFVANGYEGRSGPY